TRGPYGGFDYVFTTAPYKQILFNEGWSGELEFNPQYLIVVGRTLVLASPQWYPTLELEARRKLFNFARHVLDEERFEWEQINRYLED
ncbi:MAG TPA: hypothetical protein PKE45_15815, partial [Caldilineaceae bacterium]|nr:hypothetical protein [Caldilineaceae bacterium]